MFIEWVRVENRRFQLIWLHSVSESKKLIPLPPGPCALHKLHNPLLRHWYELKLTKCLRVDVLFFYLITLFSKKTSIFIYFW